MAHMSGSLHTFFAVHSLSHVRLFVTPWTTAHQASLSFTISQSLFKCMSIESVMPSSHLILCHPLLVPSILSSIRVFSNQSALCIRWPNYWSFSIHPSNEYSGLISFRIDWFDLSDVQGTLESLLQHHSLKASTLQHSTFFMVQLSHSYMTTGKITPLTIQTPCITKQNLRNTLPETKCQILQHSEMFKTIRIIFNTSISGK